MVRETFFPLSLTLSTTSWCFSVSVDSSLTSRRSSPSFMPALSAALPLSTSRRKWTVISKDQMFSCCCFQTENTIFRSLFPHMCVRTACSPGAGGSRSSRTCWPGCISWLCRASYLEWQRLAGWASFVLCRSSHSRCQPPGWWCDCHFFSATLNTTNRQKVAIARIVWNEFHKYFSSQFVSDIVVVI